MLGSWRRRPSSLCKAFPDWLFSTAASSRRSGRSTPPSCRSTPSPRSWSSGCCSTTTWPSGRPGSRSRVRFLGQPLPGLSAAFSLGSGDHSGSGVGHARHGLPDGDPDVLPVRVRRDHGDHPGRLGARTHELPGLGDFLPGMDDLRLYGGRVQPLGRRLARRRGCGGLLGRLRHPSRRRLVRLRRRGDGRSASQGGSRSLPAQQPADHLGRRRHLVAGLERLQRRRSVLRQR